MKLFDKIFNKSKNIYKINQKSENNLVYMLKPKKKVKIKSKIIVPETFCVLTLSHEKLLDLIPSGEHELNGFTIEKTCKINKLDKPSKKGYKKEFSVDFYYVNLNLCRLSNEFYIKKIKTNVFYTLEFKINNVQKFIKFLIGEKIIFDENFAVNFLRFSLSKIIYYYFLDNKIIEENSTKDFVIKKLNSIGLEILNLEIKYNINDTIKSNSLEANNTIINENTTKNNKNQQNFDINQENEVKNLDNKPNKSSIINLDDINSESISYFVCDECGAKLHKSSNICYNCKKSFVEKNTCENCGMEIKNGTYVCPYCNCVLIK